jgi:hypothetical protein
MMSFCTLLAHVSCHLPTMFHQSATAPSHKNRCDTSIVECLYQYDRTVQDDVYRVVIDSDGEVVYGLFSGIEIGELFDLFLKIPRSIPPHQDINANGGYAVTNWDSDIIIVMSVCPFGV